MRSLSTLSLTLLLTGGASVAHAQQVPPAATPPPASPVTTTTPLTLEAAIAEAQRGRPLLQLGQERIGLARARITEARSRLRPQIDFEGGLVDGPTTVPPSGLRGPSGSVFTEHATAALNLVQTLLDFGRTHSLVRARKAELGQSREALEADRNQVTLDVTRGYLQALQARRLLDVNRQIVQQRLLVVRQAETLLQNGLASRVDVDLARLNVSQAELSVVRAQNDLENAYALLSQAVGRVVPSNTPLHDPLAGTEVPVPALDTPGPATPVPASSAVPVPDLETAIANAQRDRPELRAATAQLRAAGYLVSAAKAEKRPLVAAVGSVGKLNAQPLFDTQDQPYAVGLAVTIPVFTGGQLESQVEQARRNAGIAQAQLNELANTVRQQATSAVANLATANEAVRVAEAQLTQATDALKLATGRYQSQLGSIVELSQAQVAYATAQNDLIRARYERELARAALTFALGGGSTPAGGK